MNLNYEPSSEPQFNQASEEAAQAGARSMPFSPDDAHLQVHLI